MNRTDRGDAIVAEMRSVAPGWRTASAMAARFEVLVPVAEAPDGDVVFAQLRDTGWEPDRDLAAHGRLSDRRR